MSGKTSKLRPSFINKLIVSTFKLRGRRDLTNIARLYFQLYEHIRVGCKSSSEQEDNYRKKIRRFRDTSPLHKKKGITNNTREQQARCIIYACILVYIDKIKDKLNRDVVSEFIKKIPYEDWKSKGFDLFPTKIYFVPSLYCKNPNTSVYISFWDFVSGDPAVYECSNGVDYSYPNVDVIKEYCLSQFFNNKCIAIYMTRLKHFPRVAEYIYSSVGIEFNAKQVNHFDAEPVFYRIEHEGFSRQMMEQNTELYKGLIESASLHYERSKGKGYVVKKPALPEEIGKDWLVFKRSIMETHSKIMENFMRVARLTLGDMTKN